MKIKDAVEVFFPKYNGTEEIEKCFSGKLKFSSFSCDNNVNNPVLDWGSGGGLIGIPVAVEDVIVTIVDAVLDTKLHVTQYIQVEANRYESYEAGFDTLYKAFRPVISNISETISLVAYKWEHGQQKDSLSLECGTYTGDANTKQVKLIDFLKDYAPDDRTCENWDNLNSYFYEKDKMEIVEGLFFSKPIEKNISNIKNNSFFINLPELVDLKESGSSYSFVNEGMSYTARRYYTEVYENLWIVSKT